MTTIKRPPLVAGGRYTIVHRDNKKFRYNITLTYFDDVKMSYRIDGKDFNNNYKWVNFDTEWYLLKFGK